MNSIMKLIGWTLLFGGIGLGIYVGFWLMFIGGIVQIIDSIKHDVNALEIAIGFIKIWCAGIVGWVSGMICCAIGAILIDN